MEQMTTNEHGGKLEIRPISYRTAMEFVRANHRHHGVTSGQKFAIGCYSEDGTMHGCAVCCRPVALALDDGMTLEVARLCTDGTKNACSLLYGASARVGRAMGYKKIITYILQTETGTSLKASGWTLEDPSCGGVSWNHKTRPRTDKAPLEKKQRWSKIL